MSMEPSCNRPSRHEATITPSEQSKLAPTASASRRQTLHRAALNITTQASAPSTRTLSEMPVIPGTRAAKSLDARLENLPKELVDLIVVHLEPQDLGALSAACKQLYSKMFDRKFEHLHFCPCDSKQKLTDIREITSHAQFRLTVRSVTMRIGSHKSCDAWTVGPCQRADFLPLLQQATNITYLTIVSGSSLNSDDPETLLRPITLPSLKKLSLEHVHMDLDILVDFINAQPKLEEVRIDGAFIQDVELGDIAYDESPLDWNMPVVEEQIFGFRPSVLVRERTHVRNVFIDEQSDKLYEPAQKDRRKRNNELSWRWTGREWRLWTWPPGYIQW